MTATYLTKLSRRETLQWFAAISLTSVLPRETRGEASTLVDFRPTATGYGTDPDLHHPVVTWPLLMTPHQLQLTAVIADLILPGTATAPAPSAIAIPEFVNEWVSAPYPDQVQDRETIFGGLAWIDAEAVRRARWSFLESDDQTRSLIVDEIARNNSDGEVSAQGIFFQRFRYLVLGAYYTTPEGFKDIGYIGNVPLSEYPPITNEERKILDKALLNLELSET
jgi:hypothetical protein